MYAHVTITKEKGNFKKKGGGVWDRREYREGENDGSILL